MSEPEFRSSGPSFVELDAYGDYAPGRREAMTWEEERGWSCCGGYREHGYRCRNREWPTTATPEIRRQAVRGDCIGPAHAEIEDLIPCALDYQQRKKLTEILARTWDDGFEYGARPHPREPAP